MAQPKKTSAPTPKAPPPEKSLPHEDEISKAFGVDKSKFDVRVHHEGYTGSSVGKEASRAMGACGYSAGDRIAMSNSSSLHTAAHEAAHVVQQPGKGR